MKVKTAQNWHHEKLWVPFLRYYLLSKKSVTNFFIVSFQLFISMKKKKYTKNIVANGIEIMYCNLFKVPYIIHKRFMY